MFVFQKTPLNMFWEYWPSSPNVTSDRLRAKRALLWTRKAEKEIWMAIVDTTLASEGIDLFVDMWEAQPCL